MFGYGLLEALHACLLSQLAGGMRPAVQVNICLHQHLDGALVFAQGIAHM